MKAHITRAAAVAMVLGLFFSPLLALPGQNQGKATEKININTASAEELQKLPRIGPKVALRIIEFRKQNGPFKKVEELMKVRGIGEKVFLKFKEQLAV